MLGHRVNITLYTVFDDDAYVHQSFVKNFRPIAKEITRKTTNEHEIVTVHLKDDTVLMLYISTNDALIKHHRKSLSDMFGSIEHAKYQLQKDLLQQIDKFNCICGCVFEKNDNQDRTQGILEVLFDAAQDTHSYLLLPPMNLYNETGQLVLSKNGESDLTHIEVMDHNTYRTNRSMEILRHHRVRTSEFPAKTNLQNSSLQNCDAIVYRIGALYAICVYAEVMRNSLKNNNLNQFVRQIKNEFEDADRQFREDAWVYIHQMNTKFKGKLHEHFTSEEHQFLNLLHPNMQQLNKFYHQFEACYVLLWAIGYIDQLPYPDKFCSISKIATIMWNIESFDSFLKSAQLRTRKELLDEADLHERYYHVCKEQVKRRNANTLNQTIVEERYFSFQWLLKIYDNSNWDTVRKNEIVN